MGIIPAPRKRLRVWIENCFKNGSRMTMESIELDKAEVMRLFQCLADHLNT
jgi:hypothetical protein